MKQQAAELAVKGVFIGTSWSWKYEGWLDQLYTPARYEYRGKVVKTRFERGVPGVNMRKCSKRSVLMPRITRFGAKNISPGPHFIRFRHPISSFGLLVTDEITVRKFPKFWIGLARKGWKTKWRTS